MNAMRYLPQALEQPLVALLREWREDHPRLGVLALLPEAEAEAVTLLQRVCKDQGVALAGAIFPALIQEGAFCTRGVWLLRIDAMPFQALYTDLSTNPEALSTQVASIAAELKPHLHNRLDTTLFLLFDAMVPNIGSILDELYLNLANRVHYMGANAGSESFKPLPCLFDGERIVGRGVLAMLMQPHQGAILDHGYGVPPAMIAATSTEGNRILQIDWRPAFEVYQEMARTHYGVSIDRENFYQYAVHFPVGIVRANGVVLVRIPVALEDDGSLFCIGEVPPNSLLTLLQAPTVDSLQTLDTLAVGLAGFGDPLPERDLLLFYCAGRRLHLGAGAAEEELRALKQRTSVPTISGALSLGELGSTTRWGYPLFHNATLVASLWNGRVA